MHTTNTKQPRPNQNRLARKAALLLRLLRTGNAIGRYHILLSGLALPCLPLDLFASLAPQRESSSPGHAPAIFLSGYSRSGTTLVYQALSQAWEVEYVSNLVMLFPRSFPRMLHLYRALSSRRSTTFDNYYGRTLGLYGTNDGPELMRQWFDLDALNQDSIAACMNDQKIIDFFDMFTRHFDSPLLMKNCNLHPFFPHLAKLLPQARFVFVKRRPANIIDSTLRAREFVQGTRDAAWELSLARRSHPGEGIDPIREISSNIASCYRDVDAFRQRHPDRVAVVWYEEFCRSPADAMHAMHSTCFGAEMPATTARIPDSFEADMSLKTSPADQERILAQVAADFPEQS